MGATALAFFIILWLIEYRILSRIIYYIHGLSAKKVTLIVGTTVFDSDVRNENDRVNAMTSKDLKSSNLVIKNLTKFYGDFMAVKGISVAVKK